MYRVFSCDVTLARIQKYTEESGSGVQGVVGRSLTSARGLLSIDIVFAAIVYCIL